MSMGRRRASATRLARVAAVGAVVAALAVGMPALASAAPPKKTATPSITSAPATWVNVTTASFTITDATAGAVLSCQVDGSAWKTCTSPYALTGVKAGAHTFAVKATAAGYKPSGSASRAWNVDLTAPDAPTVTPATTPTKQTTVSVSFASLATDVVSYQCSVDGAAAVPCTSPDPVAGGIDGPHTLAVRAVDHAGNVSAAGSTTWLQDSSTPKPVINAMPPSVTSSTSATLGFSSAEPGVTFQCSKDSAAY